MPENSPIRWRKHVLDTAFRSEGVAVADVDGDGRPDVLTGNYWYRAPEWSRHLIRPAPEFDGATGYSNSFINFAHDVDGDGHPDLIVIGFPGEKAVWLQNPGPSGGPWQEHLISETACNESPAFADVNSDGRPELILSLNESVLCWLTPGEDPTTPWRAYPISAPGAPGTARYAHGLGVGDVDGDGRPEVLCRHGYWSPRADPRDGPWHFTPAPLGPDCAHMHVYDLNGDGVPDVISSSAHLKGIWWFEQRRGLAGSEWTQHEIDASWSQSHAVLLADLDGDGRPELVTGKRFWAHGPQGDVEPNHPAVLYWYRPVTRPDGSVSWSRHLIDDDSGVGTQFSIADINGDGRPDVITANKKGVFVFEQLPG